ncbi:hypothetical protein TOT_040000001 [Theileria orientalis strain Shintoku]|uniref:Uncharacterized protein n=1 Tax=Theileria orientalis strain Shintoku TaxID=869250 RepID=J4D9V4_THEOR|nr:hypothetical protein TOT_040000001 [Theileria orientalis strain Shintoku]PVC50396.1 hypothetical protein MACL_00002309 [Theileria orientalis]PVC52096.1 hypothetical protein MACL_00001026 [Theileria orientalis]PVC52583.1 hypothetical protein MACL_00000662 [Theileria orientalis]BAM41620.1 hypothetical protein TOT_040000001 [Theileria orientalis strain Shintoku]|eukprot:XP_009691921.1 hypothetical protein TOT_040000001 [Theileria orientalis strain Shintoku]
MMVQMCHQHLLLLPPNPSVMMPLSYFMYCVPPYSLYIFRRHRLWPLLSYSSSL